MRAGSSDDRSNPTAPSPPASAPYVSSKAVPAGVSTRIAGMGRAAEASTCAGRPRARSSARAAGDANTPPARQRQLGRRSASSTTWPAWASRMATAAPDGPPPATTTSTSAGPAACPSPSGHRQGHRGCHARSAGGRCTAAMATRCPASAITSATGRRPPAASRARSSTTRVRAAHGQRPVVARVAVARGDGQQRPGAEPVVARAHEIVDDHPATRDARGLQEECDSVGRLKVVEHEGRVHDVEGAVRPGQRPPVAQHDLEAFGPGNSRVQRAGGVEHLLARVERGDGERAGAAARTADEGQRDVGRPGAHVEHAVRPRAPGQEPVQCVTGSADAAKAAVDPREVAQVAAQGDRVVEGPIEQFVGSGETTHAPAAYRRPDNRPVNTAPEPIRPTDHLSPPGRPPRRRGG